MKIKVFAFTLFCAVLMFSGCSNETISPTSVDKIAATGSNPVIYDGTPFILGGTYEGLSSTIFNGNIYIFYLRTDKKICYKFFNGSTWSAEILPSENAYSEKEPEIANFNNRLYMFSRGISNNQYIYYSYMDVNGNWTSCGTVGAWQTNLAPSVCASNQGGTPKLHLTVRGTDGYIWSSSMNINGTWNGGGRTNYTTSVKPASFWKINNNSVCIMFANNATSQISVISQSVVNGSWALVPLGNLGTTTDQGVNTNQTGSYFVFKKSIGSPSAIFHGFCSIAEPSTGTQWMYGQSLNFYTDRAPATTSTGYYYYLFYKSVGSPDFYCVVGHL